MTGMGLFGFLLLLTGWGIVLTALVLLKSSSMLAAFVLAGVAVEMIGLILAARSHLPVREGKR
jgi:hypothetical protein